MKTFALMAVLAVQASAVFVEELENADLDVGVGDVASAALSADHSDGLDVDALTEGLAEQLDAAIEAAQEGEAAAAEAEAPADDAAADDEAITAASPAGLEGASVAAAIDETLAKETVSKKKDRSNDPVPNNYRPPPKQNVKPKKRRERPDIHDHNLLKSMDLSYVTNGFDERPKAGAIGFLGSSTS